MKMSRRNFVVSALLVAACASSEPSPAPTTAPAVGADNATVVVQNNRADAVNATIFLLPDVGQRISLGRVDARQNGSFTYLVRQPGNFTLSAQRQTDGTEFKSDRFRLSNGDVATWNMSINRVTVGRR